MCSTLLGNPILLHVQVQAIFHLNHYELKGKSLKVSWGRHQQNRGPTQVQPVSIQQQHPMLGITNMGPPMYGQQYLNPGAFQQPPFVPRNVMPPPQGAIQPPGAHHPGLHNQQQQQQLQQQQPQGPGNLTLDGMGYYAHMYYPPNPHGPQ